MFSRSNFARLLRAGAKQRMLHSKLPSMAFSEALKYTWDEDIAPELNHAASEITHKSNAQQLINNLPVVEVDDDVVRCGGVHEHGHGHPVEYI